MTNPTPTPRMLYVGGSQAAFRCQCGANIFHLVPDTLKPPDADHQLRVYECNGCGEWYCEAPAEQAESA